MCPAGRPLVVGSIGGRTGHAGGMQINIEIFTDSPSAQPAWQRVLSAAGWWAGRRWVVLLVVAVGGGARAPRCWAACCCGLLLHCMAQQALAAAALRWPWPCRHPALLTSHRSSLPGRALHTPQTAPPPSPSRYAHRPRRRDRAIAAALRLQRSWLDTDGSVSLLIFLARACVPFDAGCPYVL